MSHADAIATLQPTALQDDANGTGGRRCRGRIAPRLERAAGDAKTFGRTPGARIVGEAGEGLLGRKISSQSHRVGCNLFRESNWLDLRQELTSGQAAVADTRPAPSGQASSEPFSAAQKRLKLFTCDVPEDV